MSKCTWFCCGFFGISFILWSQDSNLFILPLCYYHKVIVDISLVSQFKHPFFVLLVTALWSSLGKISPPLLVHVQGGGMTQDWPIWALGSSGYGEWFRDEYTIPSEPTGRNPFFFKHWKDSIYISTGVVEDMVISLELLTTILTLWGEPDWYWSNHKEK